MSKYREKYLEDLTNAVSEILKKNEFTETDIDILFLYKRELARYEYTPVFKKLVKLVKDTSKVFNKGEEKIDG